MDLVYFRVCTYNSVIIVRETLVNADTKLLNRTFESRTFVRLTYYYNASVGRSRWLFITVNAILYLHR